MKFLRDLTLQTTHLKQNFIVKPDAFSTRGANTCFAYRGYLGITVQQHLYIKHHIRLRYSNLPCICEFGGNWHQSFYPLELLQIIPLNE
jgi:hypothetical protein